MATGPHGVSIDTDGRGIARLTLDRPERHNAFDGALIGAMIVGILALTIISFLVYMTGSIGGWLTGALLVVVAYIPFFGLPLALKITQPASGSASISA